jgi:hypothetical protein
MKEYRGVLFFIVLALFYYQCSRTTKTSKFDQQEIDSLVIAFKVLEDSANIVWKTMIEDDDEKHLFMKRLLLEVSYTNVYDKKRFEELNEAVEKLQELRYDRVTMRNSELIDKYDSATFELTGQVMEFARNHPSYDQFPLMEELIGDINDKNGMILIHRIHYDGFAIERNKLVETNKEKLLEGLDDSDVVELPLFQLSG